MCEVKFNSVLEDVAPVDEKTIASEIAQIAVPAQVKHTKKFRALPLVIRQSNAPTNGKIIDVHTKTMFLFYQ